MKLEAGWILTNLAYGDQSVISLLLTPELVQLLNSILNNPNVDTQIFDQIIFFMGNITGDSKAIREQVLQQFDLIGAINQVIRNNHQLPVVFASNYVWVAHNLSKESRKLNKAQI